MMGGMRGGGAPGQAPQRPNPWGSTGQRNPQTGNLPGAQPGRMGGQQQQPGMAYAGGSPGFYNGQQGNYQNMLSNQLRQNQMMGGMQPQSWRQNPMTAPVGQFQPPQQQQGMNQRLQQQFGQAMQGMQGQQQPMARPDYQAAQMGQQQSQRPSYRDAIQSQVNKGNAQQGTTGSQFFGAQPAQQQNAAAPQQAMNMQGYQAAQQRMQQQAQMRQAQGMQGAGKPGMNMQGYNKAQRGRQRNMQRQLNQQGGNMQQNWRQMRQAEMNDPNRFTGNLQEILTRGRR